MPAARESLLDAAFTALAGGSWAAVRMVDVASAAGVSRQTLYNEFGGKDGLARALVRREADAYLSGVERVLTQPPGATDPGERLAAAAVWTVRTATDNPLVRAVLTGCWGERLPAPAGTCPPPPRAARSLRPRAAERAEGLAPLPTPVELLGQVRERSVRLLAGQWPRAGPGELARACDTAARLALAYVVAPAPAADVATVVRGALAAPPLSAPGRRVSAPSRRAGAPSPRRSPD
ncbi:TetR/AcrR family transcriptional regulator [Streptomyces sp. NEAU-Y11]|uniref:TetR/AcrR family transcriptional regulator n=1 Tax=Streptomyces cucumeris TaxID=2962890 RepID=UPI0020C91B33|nr:TetR/AcrR family transcriptional regulator [Streptomyces sp. NEAU-Y11]MCP9206284.1 TetR/AcrR family transcriptional regulator [Streptomyces sp. NEAU-Y11]